MAKTGCIVAVIQLHLYKLKVRIPNEFALGTTLFNSVVMYDSSKLHIGGEACYLGLLCC